ncbi:MAG: Ig-like domain-containing protein [Bacteroidales bacterium]|nr:Ig-like domain-containing protein [Bacteroidales bacterium]
MKKLFTFGAIALSALAVLSCKQELKVEVEPGMNGAKTEICATRESNSTKTSWDNPNNPTKIVWGPNNQLSVFSTDNPEPNNQNLYFYVEAAAYTAYVEGGYESLTFTHGSGEIPGTAPYWSVYPYDRSNAMVDGHVQIPFKFNQTASARCFDPGAFAAAAYSESMKFNFKNLYGLLAIKVGENNVSSVKLKSKKVGERFSTTRTILGFGGELYTVPAGEDFADEITLTASEGSFTVGETYFMVVPPMTFEEGATFSLYNGNTLITEKGTSGAVSVERNKVHLVSELTVGDTPGPGTEGDTVADIVAQITSTDSKNPSEYSVTNLAGAVVSYANGNNIYIEDDSAAILLYAADSGLSAGDVISGALSGTGYIYRGLPEITSLGYSFTKTTGGTIPETTITLSELSANHAANLSRRVLVKGVTVIDGIKDGDRNGTITQGAGIDYPVYAQLNNKGLQLNAGDIGDIVLFVGIYNTTNQLVFWDNSFFTQTGAITNLTITESLSISAGSTKSISVETNSTGAVSFVSNKPSVAIVDDKGVVTGVAEGTAEITVSVAADGFYSAIQKVCAVTVTASSGTPDPETIDFSSLGLSNGVAYNDPFDGGHFTIEFIKSGNNGKYYTTGTAIRSYAGNSFVVKSSSNTISQIVFVYGSGDGTNAITSDVGSFATDTWTGSASEIAFAVGGENGHRRIKSITVSYK